jgi:hypothetical protein
VSVFCHLSSIFPSWLHDSKCCVKSLARCARRDPSKMSAATLLTMCFRNIVDVITLHPGYCQGMNIVSSFLLRIFSFGRKVLVILLILMHPPYFLNDSGSFPKLKLATSDWSSLEQAPLLSSLLDFPSCLALHNPHELVKTYSGVHATLQEIWDYLSQQYVES